MGETRYANVLKYFNYANSTSYTNLIDKKSNLNHQTPVV